MSKVTANVSISLDGYAAGPNQSPDNPLGEGGERLHDWAIATRAWRAEHGREGGEDGADSEVVECRRVTGEDCYVMTTHVRDVEHLEEVIDGFALYGQTTTSIVQSSPVPPRAISAPRDT